MIVCIDVDVLPDVWLVAWSDEEMFNRVMQKADDFDAIEYMLTEEQTQRIKDMRAFYKKHCGGGE